MGLMIQDYVLHHKCKHLKTISLQMVARFHFNDGAFLVRNLLVPALSNNWATKYPNPIYPNLKTNFYEG